MMELLIRRVDCDVRHQRPMNLIFIRRKPPQNHALRFQQTGCKTCGAQESRRVSHTAAVEAHSIALGAFVATTAVIDISALLLQLLCQHADTRFTSCTASSSNIAFKGCY